MTTAAIHDTQPQCDQEAGDGPAVGFSIPFHLPADQTLAEKRLAILHDTLRSLINQSNESWLATIAGPPCELPITDPRIKQLDVPRREQQLDAANKTRNVDPSWKRRHAATDLLNRNAQRVMFLDSDDLVHCRLVEDSLAMAPNEIGVLWTSGFEWIASLNRLVRRDGTLHRRCGSTALFEAEFLRREFDSDPDWERWDMCYDARYIALLADRDAAVHRAREPRVMYRTEHGVNNMFTRKKLLANASWRERFRYYAKFAAKLARSRPVNAVVAAEFGLANKAVSEPNAADRTVADNSST